MVVGKEKSFVGNDFTGAEHTSVGHKSHDGVFHGCVIDGIDVFGRKFEASGLHRILDFLKEGQGPHTFVGA